MKLLLVFCIVFSFGVSQVFAAQLDFFTDSQIYSPGKPLFVYGKALQQEDIVLRFTDPAENVITFTQITTDDDGQFQTELFVWPEASTTLPYGTYTIEAISTQQGGLSKIIEIKFSPTTEIEKIPVSRDITTLVFTPETAAIGQPFRIFAQVTSDGLLVGGDPDKLLGTTHVHLPDGQAVNLSTSFQTLHPGLYYAEFTPTQEGTHVFHVVAFSQGTISHGSAATVVLKQDLGGISTQIIELNSVLKDTSSELDNLKSEIEGFGSSLDSASKNIDESVTSISNSVKNMENASQQLNSLLFPIVASIAIIVALQIVILARRR
ncbi:envelope protein [Candidatus Nitrosotenuis aquarius]|uniref:envelope protein n=1 Tax=Candidatus Nitrosotenuis aquarius TaxID=1846278 RepID=UPI000C1F7941|nr:envelope protein [Candidatus Nitrosotenuis aquarius]